MGRPLSYARDTAPILFSIEVERKFQSSPHANRLAVPSRRIKFDLPSGLDCFARQTVGQSAGHANVLHFAIAAKNGLQNCDHRRLWRNEDCRRRRSFAPAGRSKAKKSGLARWLET